MPTYESYCVKCKATREFDGELTVTKNGRDIAKGPCPECDSVMSRILGVHKPPVETA